MTKMTHDVVRVIDYYFDYSPSLSGCLERDAYNVSMVVVFGKDKTILNPKAVMRFGVFQYLLEGTVVLVGRFDHFQEIFIPLNGGSQWFTPCKCF